MRRKIDLRPKAASRALLPAVLLTALLAAPIPAGAQDDVTDRELEELLGESGGPPVQEGGSTTLSGLSRQFNPAISVNGLLLGTGSDEGSSDFGLQEFELQFSSAIDPNFRADVTFAVHEDIGEAHGHEEEAHEEGEPALGLEQAIITATSLPQVTLRFGKFWLPFGKHNILHTHQFPFVTAPQVVAETFGEEALNEVAIDAAPLLPLPFFSELNLVAFEGDNEGLFHFTEGTDPDEPRTGPDKAKYLAHWKNLVDVTDDDTVELGLSYLSGTNNAGDGALTTATGVDLTYKHKPAVGRGRAGWVLQGEWIGTARETGAEDLESRGYYLSAQWRALDFWWVQARYGAFTADVEEAGVLEEEETDHSDFLIGWVPTEFSALRVQYSVTTHDDEEVGSWYLQYNFVIGSHPAHSY